MYAHKNEENLEFKTGKPRSNGWIISKQGQKSARNFYALTIARESARSSIHQRGRLCKPQIHDKLTTQLENSHG